MNLTEQHEAHNGLTCAQTDAIIDAQRARLDTLTRRLAWREQQATQRLTPEEHRTAVLAALATVEALQAGNLTAVEALAPRSIAEQRAQASALVTGLAAVADTQPGLIDAIRSAVLTLTFAEQDGDPR